MEKQEQQERTRLERALDGALKRLPELLAPEILDRRVMAKIRQLDTVSWWRQSWFEWPAGWRIAFVVSALVCLAGLSLVEPAGLAAAVGDLGVVGLIVFDWTGGVLGQVPPTAWLLLGTAALLSWGMALAAGVVCWQLVRLRR